MNTKPEKQTRETRFRNLWLLGLGIHILTFLFVLDLYFTSPIKHGMTPHKTLWKPLAKRVVVFVGDGVRAEAIYNKPNWDRVDYLSDLRINGSCSWGVVHTGVPTESRPGHVAILGGLYEDPSAIMTGWQANTVEFDSVINESNYAWSYGSPDIVKIFTKKDKAKLYIDSYDPDQEDFSGRTSTINLDTWVFNRVEELLTPKGNSCEAGFIRKRIQRRKHLQLQIDLTKQREKCDAEMAACEDKYYDCFKKVKPCMDEVTNKQTEVALKQLDIEIEQIDMYPPCIYDFTESECEQLCKDGNIFFLHLLGMDTAGHVHKPDSKEYLENLKAIDKGIRDTVFLFHEFFNDNQTAFLFTSDHGMTNWGSHGDGSEHETEVPYILWGKGVYPNQNRQDLKQADLAPLIASLIGIPIPVNSVGILPSKLLNGTYRQVAEAVFANVMQHIEQYKLLLKEFENDPLFEEYPVFKEEGYMNRAIKYMRELLEVGDPEKNVIKMGEELMKDILKANAYMRNFHFKPKLITVMIGFLLWIIYLALSIHVRQETLQLVTDEHVDACQHYSRFWTPVLIILSFIYLKGLNIKYFTYMYPLFPLGVLLLFSEDKAVINQLLIIAQMSHKTKFILRTVLYAILVQLLVFGFFNRLFCAGVIVILSFWLTQNNLPISKKAIWLFITCTLAILQVFDPSTKFKYYGLAIGSLIWLCIYFTFIIPEGKAYINYFDLKFKRTTRNIIVGPLLAYIVSASNTLYVAWAFDSELGLSDINLIISWVITAIILFLIPIAPTGIFTRFGHIAACLMVPYSLMSVNIDLIFYGILVVTLYNWMQTEAAMHSPLLTLSYNHFSIRYVPQVYLELSAQYRRTYFYLALTVCYFFAIGNMASFNGFDPQWTRAYVATFNPLLMAALIIIKMIIPFFLITCAFYAIVLSTRSNYTNVFMILLLFLDQMVLNFMLFIRNEGSWKEIGKSLSHFAVMEAMALVMLLFFGIARYVCTFRIGDSGTGFEPKPDEADESDTNIQSLVEEGYKRQNQTNTKSPMSFDYSTTCTTFDLNVDLDLDPGQSTESSYPTETSSKRKEIKKGWWNYLSRFIQSSSRKFVLRKGKEKLDKFGYLKKKRNFPFHFLSYPGSCSKVKSECEVIEDFDEDFVEPYKIKSEIIEDFHEIQLLEDDDGDDDSINSSSSMQSVIEMEEKVKTKMTSSLNNFMDGSNEEVFLKAFDLGIKAALEHCKTTYGDIQQFESEPIQKIELSSQSIQKQVAEDKTKVCKPIQNQTRKHQALNERTHEDWEFPTEIAVSKPIYNLDYYDIFPTVDKIQAKETRTIYEKPFCYDEGYLNIRGAFKKNEKEENIGLISVPSYDDIDVNFYYTNYSESYLSDESFHEDEFKPTYCKEKVCKMLDLLDITNKSGKFRLRRIKSEPIMRISSHRINKVPSESDLTTLNDFNNKVEAIMTKHKIKEEIEKDPLLHDTMHHGNIRLEKQLEKFNLSKAVYSTIKGGLKVASKISIIRTESYFKPNELEPAGSRLFRGLRTTFNSPDVLKLTPGLSTEQSAFYFMNEAQKEGLIKKLLASTHKKTPAEQELIRKYLKSTKTSILDKAHGFITDNSTSTTSSLSSIQNKDDHFEVLHKEALKNQKLRRRERRQMMKQLVKEAKERDGERIEQERLSRERAEAALRAEAERNAEINRARKSSITLVESQSMFNLGEIAPSGIKIMETTKNEEILRIGVELEEGKEMVEREELKKTVSEPKAIIALHDLAKTNPGLTKFLTYFENDYCREDGSPLTRTKLIESEHYQKHIQSERIAALESQGKARKDRKKTVRLMDTIEEDVTEDDLEEDKRKDLNNDEELLPGNYTFRKSRKTVPLPTTRSLFTSISLHKKKDNFHEPDTSTDSDEEGPNDRRRKRRKLKMPTKGIHNSERKEDPKVASNSELSTIEMDQTPTTRESKPKTFGHGIGGMSAGNGSGGSDRYDKIRCPRKRPTQSFFDNIDEMAQKLSNLDRCTNDDDLCYQKLAKIPIKIVPGLLASGGNTDKIIPEPTEGHSTNLWKAPCEEAIIEEFLDDEISNQADKINTNSDDKVMQLISPGRRLFIKSSPTLLKLNATSTLVTDANATETRISCDTTSNLGARVLKSRRFNVSTYQHSMCSPFKKSESECPLQTQASGGGDHETNQSRLSYLRELPEIRSYLPPVTVMALSSESMPDRTFQKLFLDDSDPSSWFSDLPDDNVKETKIYEKKMPSEEKLIETSKKKPESLVTFSGVTTSLKKVDKIEQTSSHEMETCLDQYSISRPKESTGAIPKSTSRDNTKSSKSSSCDSSKKTDEEPPEFFVEGPDDPSKYLLKVENWLKRIDKPHQGSDLEHIKSEKTDDDDKENETESTVTTDDLLDEEELLKKGSTEFEDDNSMILASIVSVDEVASMEIAKKLIEEQRKMTELSDDQNRHLNLVQAHKVVNYILQCARDLKIHGLSPTGKGVDIGTSTEGNLAHRTQDSQSIQTQCEQISSWTQVSFDMKSRATGTDKIYQTHVGIQKNEDRETKSFMTDQCTQYQLEMHNKYTFTENVLTKLASSIGIQHSFSDIAVNTDAIPENVNTGIQSTVLMVDMQVGTEGIERVASFENANVSNDFHEIVENPRVLTASTNSQPDQPSVRIKQQEKYSLPNLFTKTCEFGKGSPDVPDIYKTTILHLRGSPRSFPKPMSNAGKALRPLPTLPDELCNPSELQRRQLQEICSSKSSVDLDCDSLSQITSRYVSPRSPLTDAEKPPFFVPPLDLPRSNQGTPEGTPQSSRVCLDILSAPSTSAENTERGNLEEIAPSSSYNLGSAITLRSPKISTISSLIHELPPQPTPELQFQIIEKLLSAYARHEASKPYRSTEQPSIEVENADTTLPNPQPKVKSVPRTDYAELPEEHHEMESNLVVGKGSISIVKPPMTNVKPFIIPEHGKISPLPTQATKVSPRGGFEDRRTRRMSYPPDTFRSCSRSISRSSSNQSSTRLEDNTTKSTNVKALRQFTSMIQKWKREGMSEDAICHEIQRRKGARRGSH